MQCPVCSCDMRQRDFGAAKIDVCVDGCKGMWFDWMELGKVDEKDEGLGDALKEALKYPRTNDDARGQIPCPKCAVPMHIHKYASNKEVNVDECYACGGFFLDSGELQEIRDNHMSEEEREEYTRKLVDEIPEHKEAVDELDREKARIVAIDRFTRFLRLSYYIK